jgi:hypothetical protein
METFVLSMYNTIVDGTEDHRLRLYTGGTKVETRWCYACQAQRDISLFRKHKVGGRYKDGMRWSSRCVECERKRVKELEPRLHGESTYEKPDEWKKDKAKRIVKEAKAGGCKCCGESNPVVIQFHHVEKKSVNWTKYRDCLHVVESELRKCVAICANCHLKVHAGQIDVSNLPRVIE